MKIKELTQEIEQVLKIENSLRGQFAQLRIMGSLYGKFIYNKLLKNTPVKYSGEQVIEATKLALEFINKTDISKLEEKHVINIIINAINRQLEWNFFSEDDLDDVENIEF